jgi:hypothetical protein
VLQYNIKKKLRQDRSTEEIEYEKAKNECTFHPIISPYEFKISAEDRRAASRKRYLEELQKGKKRKSPHFITGRYTKALEGTKQQFPALNKNPSASGKTVL